jgi:hypothetical protein
MKIKKEDLKDKIEQIIAERVNIDDHYDIEKITDNVFSEYQKWKNKDA